MYLKRCVFYWLYTHTHTFDAEYCLEHLFPLWVDMAVPIFMLITGLNYTNSYLKNKIHVFSLKFVITSAFRGARLIIPFIPIFLFEYFNNMLGKFNIIKLFIHGGTGPGSYYLPVMIQLIIIYPLIIWIIKKYKKFGLLSLIIVNLAFELLAYNTNLTDSHYRLLCFRYLTFISLGSYFALFPKSFSCKELTTMFTLGFCYIVTINYTAIEHIPPFNKAWQTTTMLSAFYIFPIFKLLIDKFANLKELPKVLKLISKATWHIFLIQMVYFMFELKALNEQTTAIVVTSNITFCVSSGIIFYFIDRYIQEKLRIKELKNWLLQKC